VLRIVAPVLAIAAAAHAAVDEQLVGVWTTKVGDSTLTWEILDSGAYVLRADGAEPPPGEYGAMDAAEGRWKLRTAASQHARGRYTLEGDTLTVVSVDRGKHVWERVSKSPRFTPPPLLPDRLRTLGGKEAVAVARAHAALWRADAVLVAVTGTASRDGTFDITANKPTLVFTFRSPTTKEILEVMPMTSRDMAWHPCPADGELTVPVADGFLDLTQILNVSGHDLGARIRVRLRAWTGRNGDRTAWEIGDGPFPSENLRLDALTGKPVTIYEILGTLSPEVWKKGKPLKLGDDLADWRREADLWAREWRDRTKAYEIWVTGTWDKDRLKARSVVFRYFSEVPGEERNEVPCARVTVREDGLTGQLELPRVFKPTPLPGDLIGAEEAAGVLWKLNPQVPPDHTYLQLVHIAKTPNEEEERDASTWPLEFDQDATALHGRVHYVGVVPEGAGWTWRMIARRPFPLFHRNESVLDVAYCDAKTAAALSESAPTFFPRDPR